jgi:hypothetical protein
LYSRGSSMSFISSSTASVDRKLSDHCMIQARVQLDIIAAKQKQFIARPMIHRSTTGHTDFATHAVNTLTSMQ